MSKAVLRPMMKISEMVPYLKNKNIKFDLISEEESEEYLRSNNNYYNITAYKNNFTKYQCGELAGQYIDLDFAYLKDLSIIDYRTRIVLFKMIIDIEHYLKIRILNIVEELENEDGYSKSVKRSKGKPIQGVVELQEKILDLYRYQGDKTNDGK